jgi:hypothetical protein
MCEICIVYSLSIKAYDTRRDRDYLLSLCRRSFDLTGIDIKIPAGRLYYRLQYKRVNLINTSGMCVFTTENG